MTEKITNRKNLKKYTWQIGLILLLCLQVMLVLYYGSLKTGYHEDEYYSYYSTNRSTGLYEPDREWVDKETFRKEFVVQNGEKYNYGLVSLVQSWDVHPPLFYWLLHTACSFFPGVFSKWLGIGVNLAAYIINFFLLAWLTYMVTDKNKRLTFLVSAAHGFNAAVISGVMFIRMYEWLTLFVLSCACLHVKAVKKKDLSFFRFLLPLMLVNYLGFLTQYYYIIFLFFISVGFCIWMLKRYRKISYCIRYGIFCGVSLGMAVLTYPASLSHIFRGYRGTGAVSEFLDKANTGSRLKFFAGLMNEYLFDGFFPVLLGLILLLTFILYRRKKLNAGNGRIAFEGDYTPFFLLLFAVCGYFFMVSKTALLLYETSNRYQMPVYGILLMLVITALYTLCSRFYHALFINNKAKNAGVALLFAVFLIVDAHELMSGKVLFLYEEDAERIEYARENSDIPAVILYNEAAPYHVWWCSEELMQFERIYFASEGNKEHITDETVCGSNKLIVYAADHDTQEESLKLLLECNPRLKGYKLISKKSLWSVYEFE